MYTFHVWGVCVFLGVCAVFCVCNMNKCIVCINRVCILCAEIIVKYLLCILYVYPCVHVVSVCFASELQVCTWCM